LTVRPSLWPLPQFKEVRECIQVLKTNPEQYSPVLGDCLPDGLDHPIGNEPTSEHIALTQKYISDIAEYRDINAELSPILQVVSTKMSYEENKQHKKKTNAIHFTHLRLCDGSNDVIVCRLSMHLAHDGNKLRAGDIIQLHFFTPVRYSPSGQQSGPRMPAIVVHTYSKIGYSALPDNLNSPLHCVEVTNVTLNLESQSTTNSDGGDEFEPLDDVECTSDNRFCSVHGVSVVLCICETDPVNKINLELVQQYCYFATTEVSKMTNSKKRNMLYWWYMTNHYNICGKGNRKDPPACLKAAIRKAYPEPNGMYKKFKP
jgi:hypothetical protein